MKYVVISVLENSKKFQKLESFEKILGNFGEIFENFRKWWEALENVKKLWEISGKSVKGVTTLSRG